MAMLTVMKGLPLAYNSDLQEDKEGFFDTVDTLLSSLQIMSGLVDALKINSSRMKSVMSSYILATDLADYLVGKGLSFRDAHGAVSRRSHTLSKLKKSWTISILRSLRNSRPCLGRMFAVLICRSQSMPAHRSEARPRSRSKKVLRELKKLSAATKRKKVKIAPSILSADFSRLGDQVGEAVKAGADYIHVDVMDGHFVPNISIGIPVVQSLHKITTVPLDVHLMIEKPENYIERFAAAGANIITVHAEACVHLDSTLKAIKKTGARAGVALNPATPLSVIDEILPMVDMIVIMTVNPGFGGQEFIYSVVNKLERLAQIIYNRKINAEIEVDGGITVKTSPIAVKAGANVLVAGSAIFGSGQGISKAFKELRNSIC